MDALLHWPRWGVAATLLTVVLFVGACTTANNADVVACPNVHVLKSLGEFVRFAPELGHDLTDVATEAWIERVGGDCILENGEYIVDLSIGIIARRGPANRKGSMDLRYFVAVSDRQDNILQRQSFQTSALFGAFKSTTFTDALELRIPVAKGVDGDAYTIFVGFELSPDELRYNRQKAAP
jgi:hypothetical protein